MMVKARKRAKSKRANQPTLSRTWRALLRLIPAYDPFADAGDSWFDPARAQLALDFFDECLTHVEGALAGKPFKLEPWQRSLIANLFGWVRVDEQGRTVRRFREALIYVPRKNGKTPLAAGICLFVFACEQELGSQIFSAAADKDQAALLYRHAKGMVENEDELNSRIRLYKAFKSMVLRADEGSSYRVLSADAHTKHGGNSSLVLVDELHAQPNRELVDVLQTSMASANRAQPLLILITTADWQRESICNEKYEYACSVRDGRHSDPAFLPVIYEAAAGDDWTDEKTWRKANPNLGVSVSLEYLQRECKRAQETPAFENTYKRLHLNLRTEQDVRAIPAEQWKLCGRTEDPIAWRAQVLAQLAGRQCMGGLDLGSTSDLTALVLLFHAEAKPLVLLPFFWVPEVTVEKKSRQDRIPYDVWVRQGFIQTTEGNVTDYAVVRAYINRLGDQFGIQDLAVDRLFQGVQLCTELAADGFNVLAFGQGFMSMAGPTKRFLEMVAAGEFEHGNNPVLAWMAGNAATEEDAAGNLKFSKKKSTKKIDGIVAAVMALGRAEILGQAPEPSVTML